MYMYMLCAVTAKFIGNCLDFVPDSGLKIQTQLRHNERILAKQTVEKRPYSPLIPSLVQGLPHLQQTGC